MFSHAYQPIIDINTRQVFSYEALVRGINNQSASMVFANIPINDLPQFDQQIRNSAIKMATQLKLSCNLNLNIIPACLHDEHYIQQTIDACKQYALPINKLIIEITEESIIHELEIFTQTINKFRGLGIKVAIDDFGAGYSGLNLLASFQPDIIKLDKHLIHNIESRGPSQAIVKALIDVCTSLGIDIIAEGIETQAEFLWLKDQGVFLFQGYLFAKPGFQCFPEVNFP